MRNGGLTLAQGTLEVAAADLSLAPHDGEEAKAHGSLKAAKSAASSVASASLNCPAVIGGQHVSALAPAAFGMGPPSLPAVVLTFIDL